MKKIEIRNSNIKGHVKIDGSKNAALPIICASLLNNNITTLTNIPNIKDIKNLISILNSLGVKTKFINNKLIIKNSPKDNDILNPLCKSFRASYYLMGVYLALFKHVKIYLPGGCNIGKRPIDFHLEGFKTLGATYTIEDNIIDIKIENETPGIITLPKKSLGATINIALAASTICGTTIIKNISLEPEVIDFIEFLKVLGINITRKNDILYIVGKTLENKKIKYKIIPDRIEAATFIAFGLLTNKVSISNYRLEHLKNFIDPLIKNGANIKVKKNKIISKKSTIKGFEILSGDYPLLSTDTFPLLLPVMIYGNGNSIIKETIYEDRFGVCKQLNRLGCDIDIFKDYVVVKGFISPKDNTCKALDLRCAASLLLYACASNRRIFIEDFDYIERGYTSIYEKLFRLGVRYKIHYIE